MAAAVAMSDYEQGIKAAHRMHMRMNMDIDTCADLPDTPVEITDATAYLRGVFEGGGVFDQSACSMFNAPAVTDCLNMLGIAFTVTANKTTVVLNHSNAHDLLGRIYKGVCTMTPKHEQFLEHVGPIVKCRIWRTDPEAVVPFKPRPSDVGFDLVALRKHKQLTPVTALYDTGIKIQVELGYYAEIVPRSSISKSGYMLANSTGIIDPGYTGNLYIALTKVDPHAEDPLPMPFRGCQLIIRRQIHAEMEVMGDLSSLEISGRGTGGFGSSG